MTGDFTTWLTSQEGTSTVPLFDTDLSLAVRTRQGGTKGEKRLLRRSPAMEEAMVQTVMSGLQRDDWPGLLYVMGWGSGSEFKPLYIGKTGRWGKTPGKVSVNLERIEKDRSKFARWGDGKAYHVGDLSQALFGWGAYQGPTQKYLRWAEVLFDDPSVPRLRAATNLVVIPWRTSSLAPHGEHMSLEEAEDQAIDLAIREYEDIVLNVRDEKWWAPRAAEPTRARRAAKPQLPVALVTTKAELERALESLVDAATVGLDVETTRYDQRLCLLQVSGPRGTIVVDVETVDVTGLGHLLSNLAVTKVIHNAPFERRILGALGIEVTPVVDTLQLSRTLRGGKSSHRLDAVVERELGIALDKSMQTSRWDRRPLSAAQIDYAALDAEVLLPLVAALRAADPQEKLLSPHDQQEDQG